MKFVTGQAGVGFHEKMQRLLLLDRGMAVQTQTRIGTLSQEESFRAAVRIVTGQAFVVRIGMPGFAGRNRQVAIPAYGLVAPSWFKFMFAALRDMAGSALLFDQRSMFDRQSQKPGVTLAAGAGARDQGRSRRHALAGVGGWRIRGRGTGARSGEGCGETGAGNLKIKDPNRQQEREAWPFVSS